MERQKKRRREPFTGGTWVRRWRPCRFATGLIQLQSCFIHHDDIPFSNCACAEQWKAGQRFIVQAREPSHPAGWTDTIHGGATLQEACDVEHKIRGEPEHWITGRPVETRIAKLRRRAP